MATASFGLQSIFASSAGGLSTRKNATATQCFFARSIPSLRRNGTMVVRCMEKGQPAKGEPRPSTSAAQPQPSPQPSPPPTKPKVSTKFTDVLAFSGPGPERINGRLAMVGFVAALAMELSKGENVFAQISDGGITWFLGTTAVLTVASLVPLLKGVTAESRSGGLMTSDAELWNGRLAMLGLVALAFTEYIKGGTLV